MRTLRYCQIRSLVPDDILRKCHPPSLPDEFGAGLAEACRPMKNKRGLTFESGQQRPSPERVHPTWGRGGAAGRMSCPDQASGRHSGPVARALGRAAGRRPTLAGNVSAGDAARVGNVVRRRRRRQRRYAPPLPEKGRAGQRAGSSDGGARSRSAGARRRGEAGVGEKGGPGLDAQQRAGPPPSGTEPAPGRASEKARRSCGQRLHVGKRRCSSSLEGIGAPRAEPTGARP
ncbi:uncharacterized protein LOC126083690 [Elephas maximus indicus]|uniref:uncharacterized protein LOC126083690 n=1 Tax=Elephas maximus indicus TaxID=99487 RepID=UPI0021168F20|nr:uncharacterized protein LOC126083690 [Elephas maximus indicus]